MTQEIHVIISNHRKYADLKVRSVYGWKRGSGRSYYKRDGTQVLYVDKDEQLRGLENLVLYELSLLPYDSEFQALLEYAKTYVKMGRARWGV